MLLVYLDNVRVTNFVLVKRIVESIASEVVVVLVAGSPRVLFLLT